MNIFLNNVYKTMYYTPCVYNTQAEFNMWYLALKVRIVYGEVRYYTYFIKTIHVCVYYFWGEGGGGHPLGTGTRRAIDLKNLTSKWDSNRQPH